jgi:hypothetical protein
MIFYTWDSFVNNPNAKNILNYFDKKFTFDRIDALNLKISFRPLFYIDQYETNKLVKTFLKYDLLFIGTAHSDRYLISNKIKNILKENDLHMYTYYYVQNIFVFLYKSLFDKTFIKFKLKDLKFKSLNANNIIELYNQSDTILDINNPGQIGLTIRTFEVLAASKKLITTNTDIINYPFYNENNILIIDRNNINLNIDFLKNEFSSYDPNILEYMSLKGWVNEIFFNIKTL